MDSTMSSVGFIFRVTDWEWMNIHGSSTCRLTPVDVTGFFVYITEDA
jgi:hypothetical protein